MPMRDRVMPLNQQQIEIEFEGCIVKADRSLSIKPGDLYIAERNTGPKLLTCDWVSENYGVFSKEGEYAYDLCECAKVTSIDGEEV